MPLEHTDDNLQLIRHNASLVKKVYPNITRAQMRALRELTKEFSLSIAGGDLLLLDGGWFVTHGGLLRLAHRRECLGIDSELQDRLCEPASARWVFKATVFKTESQSFTAHGDADPLNVSSLVRGAEMRAAETRAIDRALRLAFGIGVTSVEEIGSAPIPINKLPAQCAHTSGRGNGIENATGPRVRDRLLQTIRRHRLDPELVRNFASDYCQVKTLKDADRQKVEEFVALLADWAEKDRDALLCRLNSFARPKQEEVVA